MEIYDLIGYSAMILIIISYIPQIVKIHITKKTEDISLGTYILLGVSLALWFIYGLLLNLWPMIVTNGVAGSLVIWILIFKVKHLLSKKNSKIKGV